MSKYRGGNQLNKTFLSLDLFEIFHFCSHQNKVHEIPLNIHLPFCFPLVIGNSFPWEPSKNLLFGTFPMFQTC